MKDIIPKLFVGSLLLILVCAIAMLLLYIASFLLYIALINIGWTSCIIGLVFIAYIFGDMILNTKTKKSRKTKKS